MNPNMINKIKKIQKQMMEAQEALERKEFFGKASGVTVIMQGTRQVIDVQINPEITDEVDMLQDAILLAVNDALKQIDKEQEETMGQFSGGLGGFGFLMYPKILRQIIEDLEKLPGIGEKTAERLALHLATTTEDEDILSFSSHLAKFKIRN